MEGFQEVEALRSLCKRKWTGVRNTQMNSGWLNGKEVSVTDGKFC